MKLGDSSLELTPPSSISAGRPSNGPNAGVWFILNPYVWNEQNHSYRYIIVPDLDNPGSEFYQRQCGNYDPISNPNGYISGFTLLAETRRHEYNHPAASHWGHYYQKLYDPQYNLDRLLEKQVGHPALNGQQFGAPPTTSSIAPVPPSTLGSAKSLPKSTAMPPEFILET